MRNDLHLQTLTATALGWVDPATDAMAMPLSPSTSFLRDPNNLGRSGRYFTRDDNPTFLQPEALINQLEGGAGCLLFSSGMAAIVSVFQRLKPGDHVVIPKFVYSGLREWLQSQGARWGLQVSTLSEYTADTVKAAIRPGQTKIVWLETPSNPTWSIVDISVIADVAHSAGAIVAIDNTVATPILTRPIAHGADIVLHSCSKYMNGHGDLIAGAAVVAPGQEQLLQDMRNQRNENGGVLGGFEAWLLLRGMRTLYARVKTSSETAMKIAEVLIQNPAVSEVLYPGLPSHPNHDIAARQMTGGYGGMLSFRLMGGELAARRVAANVQIFRQAISFGSTESVIEHRADVEKSGSPTPRDLLRVSVGLEHPEDLIKDLTNALAIADSADFEAQIVAV